MNHFEISPLRNKCVSYLDRAEKLKQYLAGKDDNKKHKPVKDSGADKDTDSDGEDAEDAEKKKKYQRMIASSISRKYFLLYFIKQECVLPSACQDDCTASAVNVNIPNVLTQTIL